MICNQREVYVAALISILHLALLLVYYLIYFRRNNRRPNSRGSTTTKRRRSGTRPQRKRSRGKRTHKLLKLAQNHERRASILLECLRELSRCERILMEREESRRSPMLCDV